MREIFSHRVVFEVGDPARPAGELHPAERPVVAGAVDKRRLEFTAGRVCARRALRRLGLPEVAIPRGAEREPVWPPGVVGSITHTAGFCAAALARDADVASVGLDAEPAAPLSESLYRRVCRPEELSFLEGIEGEARGVLARVVFSAKETLYKAQFPLTRSFLGFLEARVRIDRVGGAFEADVLRPLPALEGRALVGRFVERDGLIVTAMELAAR